MPIQVKTEDGTAVAGILIVTPELAELFSGIHNIIDILLFEGDYDDACPEVADQIEADWRAFVDALTK